MKSSLRRMSACMAFAFCFGTSSGLTQTPPAGAPQQFGAWKIIAGPDGRPVAMTSAKPKEPDQLAGLRIECVAGGRLEYVPVALKLGQMLSLWISDAGDSHEMRLIKGRATGPSASTLSKQFLTYDANYLRNGQREWTVEMRIDDENGPMSDVPMGGFSEMRRFMLANCKS